MKNNIINRFKNKKELTFLLLSFLLVFYFFLQLNFLQINYKILFSLLIWLWFYRISALILFNPTETKIIVKWNFSKIYIVLIIAALIKIAFSVDYRNIWKINIVSQENNIEYQTDDNNYIANLVENNQSVENEVLIDPNIPVVELDSIKDDELKSIFADINEVLNEQSENTTLNIINQSENLKDAQTMLTFRKAIPLIVKKYYLSADDKADIYFSSTINSSPDYKEFKTAYYFGMLKNITKINDYVKCKDLAILVWIWNWHWIENVKKWDNIHDYYWNYTTKNNFLTKNCNQPNKIVVIQDLK